MLRVLVLCVLLAVAFEQVSGQNQLPCGFTCTRKAQFLVNIDGSLTTTTCTANGADPRVRCDGCCQSRALAAGLTTIAATGFPSTNGVDCICCTNNPCR
ncbi:hypothetical protein V3C99_013307 [Haemonchus contortus]|nr:Hypothetical protein CBG15758 [Haemonchus contortus]